MDYEEDAVEDLDLVDEAYKEDLKLAIHETRNKNYACYEAVTQEEKRKINSNVKLNPIKLLVLVRSLFVTVNRIRAEQYRNWRIDVVFYYAHTIKLAGKVGLITKGHTRTVLISRLRTFQDPATNIGDFKQNRNSYRF